jgi:hypothetical protein
MSALGEKIFFGVPCMDHKIDVDCAISVFKKLQEYGGHQYFLKGISDIAYARNLLAHKFKKTDCDWFLMIDSDISFSDEDWELLWEGDEDIVVCAYARKMPGMPPADIGLGLARIHRRVFEMIENLENESGAEMAQRFYLNGEIHTHFFPNGVTGDSRWLGEDKGFLTLCSMTGAKVRWENRTRLRHRGSFYYGYPDQDCGAKFWSPNVQIERCEACGENPHTFDCPTLKPIVVM